VKAMQNSPAGVPGFWLKVLLNSRDTQGEVYEKDRAILQSLTDMRYELHETGHGFTLIFEFEENSYFKNKLLTKSFHQLKPNMIEKCVGTEIEWNEGCDVTVKKTKKKSKKKGSKPVTKMVKQDSFFNFFKSLSADDEKKEGDDDEGKDEEEEDIAEQMDADLDLGSKIKEEVIPLALEFYMDVIDQEDDEDDEDGDEDDEGDDSDDDKKKK